MLDMYLTIRQHDLFRNLLMGFEIPFRSYIAHVVTSAYPTDRLFENAMVAKKMLLTPASPEFLNNTSKAVIFNPSRLNNDKELKVYKYVSVKDIDIYCTSSHRDDPIKDKYSKALPLSEYIRESEDDSEKSVELIRAFDKISTWGIKRIENEQQKMSVKIPFMVHYNRSQLWQVYYSQDTARYFMLVSLKEDTFDEFFFLLKKRMGFLFYKNIFSHMVREIKW